MSDEEQDRFEKFATAKPRINVLSDVALPLDCACLDSFELSYTVGPIFDIVRHPDTKPPLAIAIYGDWGCGKTSAMNWLHASLLAWNDKGKGKDKVRVKPVWFYPWKYHTREDVWRGLLAEVIINSIDVKNATIATVTDAVKRFGGFLGKSLIHVLGATALRVKSPGDLAEAEVSFAALKDVVDEYREAAHPEDAFLNIFEESLQSWVTNTLGKNERMVIFIDDLDRCMPDIALQVLEALKLYLNIDKLIFIVGVDRKVIGELVKGYYNKLELSEDKSGQYLSKMFQIEVDLAPTEPDVEKFVDQQLREIDCWKKPNLSDAQQEIFRSLIIKYAGRSPREVKRLINGSVLAGAGGLTTGGSDAKPPFEFRQGVQVFFIRKILDEQYTRASLVGNNTGDAFFRDWSKIVTENSSDENFPTVVQVPAEFIEQQTPSTKPSSKFDNLLEDIGRQQEVTVTDFAPEQYQKLIADPLYADMLELLKNHDLGELMRIPYPSDTKMMKAAYGLPMDDVTLEAIARQLGKKPGDLTDADYATLTNLQLAGKDVTDITPLKNLTNLQLLGLVGTGVADITPLQNLTNLQWLDLSRTLVADITPLKNLTNLQVLELRETGLSEEDIASLKAALPNTQILF